MKTLIAVFVLTTIAGCASGNAYQGMSAEQISALAKMKDANVACVIINSPWGRGVTTFVNVDRGVLQKGNVTVDGDCKVNVTNEQHAPVPKPAP